MPLAPGTDGGLLTGGFQEPPAKAFFADRRRDGKPHRRTDALRWSPVQRVDIGEGSADGAQRAGAEHRQLQWDAERTATGAVGGVERGVLQSRIAQARRSSPRLTTPVRGTYDAISHAYVLDWSSSTSEAPSTASPACGTSKGPSRHAAPRSRRQPRRPAPERDPLIPPRRLGLPAVAGRPTGAAFGCRAQILSTMRIAPRCSSASAHRAGAAVVAPLPPPARARTGSALPADAARAAPRRRSRRRSKRYVSKSTWIVWRSDVT